MPQIRWDRVKSLCFWSLLFLALMLLWFPVSENYYRTRMNMYVGQVLFLFEYVHIVVPALVASGLTIAFGLLPIWALYDWLTEPKERDSK